MPKGLLCCSASRSILVSIFLHPATAFGALGISSERRNSIYVSQFFYRSRHSSRLFD